MLRLLSLNLQHALPGAGAADPAGSGSGADADRANTADVANADITDPEAARTVLAVLADQIAELAPDVVALQEVDKGQARSGYLDQAAVLAELDAQIAARSHNWRLERMPMVDRAILRIAAYELRFCDEVPAQVAINEALEIAKRYSIAASVSFINGILDGMQGARPALS